MEEYQKDAFRREMNFSALERMSAYLNNCPRAIDEGEVFEVMECGVSQEEAVLMLLAAVCGLDETRSPEERELIRRYFQPTGKESVKCSPLAIAVRVAASHEMSHSPLCSSSCRRGM